jgi:pyrophosphatase PpaX
LSDYVVKVVGLAHHKTEEIRALCEEFGATPERTIMIGDLPNDLRGAVAANVRTALVARTEDVRDKLSSYDPDYLFETLGPELFHPKPHKDE